MQAYSVDELEAFRDQLDHAIKEDSDEAYRPEQKGAPAELRFLAGSSLRGSYGCDETSCRVERTRTLARFSALYCDELVVPLRLMRGVAAQNVNSRFRDRLSGTILCANEMRPLVEKRLVKFVPDDVRLCEEHFHEIEPSLKDIFGRADRLLRENRKHFTFYYLPPDSAIPLPRIEMHGPTDFLEHGSIFVVLPERLPWMTRLESGQRKHSRVPIPRQVAYKLRLVESYLGAMAHDAMVQAFYGLQYDAQYLTNLPGQVRFLNAFDAADENQRLNFQVLSQLSHRVPLFAEVPTAAILRLREEEPEAFNLYRSTMGSIVRDYVKTKKLAKRREAEDLYRDVLKPEISRLEAKSREYRRNARRSAARDAVLGVAAISLGIFGSAHLAQMAPAIEILGAGKLVKSATDAVSSMQKDGGGLKAENLYFLLRLAREARY